MKVPSLTLLRVFTVPFTKCFNWTQERLALVSKLFLSSILLPLSCTFFSQRTLPVNILPTISQEDQCFNHGRACIINKGFHLRLCPQLPQSKEISPSSRYQQDWFYWGLWEKVVFWACCLDYGLLIYLCILTLTSVPWHFCAHISLLVRRVVTLACRPS